MCYRGEIELYFHSKNKLDIFCYIWYPSTETKVNILNISVCLMSQAIQLLNLGTCITWWALSEKRIYMLYLFCSKCKLDAIFMDEVCIGHSPQILYKKKLYLYVAISKVAKFLVLCNIISIVVFHSATKMNYALS